MAKKSEKSQASILTKSNIRRIGDLLFQEALRYGKLSPIVVDTHTSYLIHNYPGEGEGRWISIHFRENLEQLSKIGSWLERSKTFLKAIKKDLYLLAKALKEDSRLSDIRMIIGLTGLSASWGRKHGFTTLPYPVGEEFIRLYNDSITGNPDKETDRLNPLNLFFFAPRGFIEEFYKEDLSCA